MNINKSTKYLIGVPIFIISGGILCQAGIYFIGASLLFYGVVSVVIGATYAESDQ